MFLADLSMLRDLLLTMFICYIRAMNSPTPRQLDKIWMFFMPIFVVFLAVDQLSKWWALSSLKLGESVDFGFALSQNYGIVFGIALPQEVIFVLTGGILALGVYLVIQEKLWQDHWHLMGLALLLAGAIGNLIDRVRLGYVVDFIKVYWWPTFNLADAFIVAAIVLFGWIFVVRGK